MWRQFRPEFPPFTTNYIPAVAAKLFDGVYVESDDLLICQVSVDKLWELNYAVSKLCRFNKKVFSKLVGDLDGKAFDRGNFPSK